MRNLDGFAQKYTRRGWRRGAPYWLGERYRPARRGVTDIAGNRVNVTSGKTGRYIV